MPRKPVTHRVIAVTGRQVTKYIKGNTIHYAGKTWKITSLEHHPTKSGAWHVHLSLVPDTSYWGYPTIKKNPSRASIGDGWQAAHAFRQLPDGRVQILTNPRGRVPKIKAQRNPDTTPSGYAQPTEVDRKEAARLARNVWGKYGLVEEYKEMNKASLDRMFGANARRMGNAVVEQLYANGITEIPNIFGPLKVHWFK